MPTIGEYRNRFNRNYIWVVPNGEGPGTWRLTADDTGDTPGPGPETNYIQANVDSGTPRIEAGMLVYINDVGNAALASAASITTGRPVGVAVNTAVANALINITTNEVIQLTNVSVVVEGAPASLETGRYYWLSTEPGKFTRTPDTTTAGAVLVQVGLATDASEMQIEIQNPLVI